MQDRSVEEGCEGRVLPYGKAKRSGVGWAKVAVVVCVLTPMVMRGSGFMYTRMVGKALSAEAGMLILLGINIWMPLLALTAAVMALIQHFQSADRRRWVFWVSGIVLVLTLFLAFLMSSAMVWCWNEIRHTY